MVCGGGYLGQKAGKRFNFCPAELFFTRRGLSDLGRVFERLLNGLIECELSLRPHRNRGQAEQRKKGKSRASHTSVPSSRIESMFSITFSRTFGSCIERLK